MESKHIDKNKCFTYRKKWPNCQFFPTIIIFHF